ncbi:hypothetical protein [Nitrososphaera viennensis]|uniref:Uncharacterized protein n=2 Tax=Nitrososphaera viennensis TaxID=1034015 RepID=A0A060HM30_9ARCH|nr:hypothetical protein [Nitrososphaera viennensis]AIC16245.1 hypothetical protein NVIE_019840 [Nitrososphaera viennensis EN76]UVS68184.1 hypothetical protein NWT39_09760 [Nitrososphaera viennensis]
MSERAEEDYHGNPGRVGGTGSPAEDIEEERARNRLWDLKEEAKWGKDTMTQKKAIEELSKSGVPAISYLEEILAVVPPGEIKQYCQDIIIGISRPLPDESEGGAEALEAKVRTPD